MILGLAWGGWFFNQLICLIILLNFLIAVISQGYDMVIAESVVDKYLTRAELNLEFFILLKAFGQIKKFNILILQMERDSEEKTDQFLGFVQTIKNSI